MGFYDERPPVNNMVTKSAYALRFGAPLITIAIFYAVTVSYAAETLPRITVYGYTFTIIHFFAIFIFIQIIQAYQNSKTMIRDEYIKQYGTRTQGVFEHVGGVFGRTITVSFNGVQYSRRVPGRRSLGYTVGDRLHIAYNPEDRSDFVVVSKIQESA